MEIFKSRIGATELLRSRGVILASNALAEMASKGKGPKYSIINGRALYRDGDLLAWLEGCAKRAQCDHGRRSADSAAVLP